MLDYGRNIESFCVLPGEQHLIAGTLNGQLLVVNIDDFTIKHEIDAHAGMIIATDAHPTLPYICALGVDHVASVWKYDSETHLHAVVQADLCIPRVENKHDYPPATSVSQAIGFHPTERKLLTRTANGAVAEIAFDDETFEFNWCRSFFEGCDTGYVRYLADPRFIFVAAGNGTIGVFDVANRATPLTEYRYNHEQIHAAEHVAGTEYLLPSDSRRVIRFDVSGQQPPVVGPTIVRDHLERVHYNKISKRAFASSFDRQVYEICPESGRMLRVAVRTPMKCRWLVTLDRDPNTMIVQCRNGALYKFDLARKLVTGVLKQTPNAMWCGAWRGDSLIIGGDGSEVLELTLSEPDSFTRENRLESRWINLGYDPGFYTKRISVHTPTKDVLLGRTDGTIHRWDGTTVRQVVDLASPLRDIQAAPEGSELFAITEDGVAHKIDIDSGRVLNRFRSPSDEPLWSLAYNHSRRLVATGEREGSLHLLNANDLSLQATIPNVRRSKRARWLDEDRLFVVSIVEVLEVDLLRQIVSVAVPNQRNTIEDFAWSHDRRYLVVVTYAQDISLFDLRTRTWMHSVSFDMHYPKGVEWMPPRAGAYQYEFLVWGRSGRPRRYRAHGARIVSLGPATEQLSAVDQRAGAAAL